MIRDAAVLQQVVGIAKRYGIRKVSVFGPSLLIIEVPRGFTLIDLVSFEDEVKAILGTDVEITTPGGLRPDVKPHILQQAVQIYPRPASDASTSS